MNTLPSTGDAKFPLGKIVATTGAIDALQVARDSYVTYLERHKKGDWGNVPKEDAKENEFSIKHGFRIVSSYTLSDKVTTIWIITEADRSITTILLPSEY